METRNGAAADANSGNGGGETARNKSPMGGDDHYDSIAQQIIGGTVHKPNLYEKIASDMRSKTFRDEIQTSIKNALTQKRMKQNMGGTGRGQPETLQGRMQKSRQVSLHNKGGKNQAYKMPYNSRHNQPGGHDIWAKPSSLDAGPTQWEACITRDNAQYRLLEKHARECDNRHEISYNTVDAKSKAAHFDDQPSTDVRKKKYRVPTCT